MILTFFGWPLTAPIVIHPQGAQGPPGGIGAMGGVGEKVRTNLPGWLLKHFSAQIQSKSTELATDTR